MFGIANRYDLRYRNEMQQSVPFIATGTRSHVSLHAPPDLLARSCPGSSGPVTVADDRTDPAG
jgi:hypothetical protein